MTGLIVDTPLHQPHHRTWIPKNLEINWPTMKHERPLTGDEWMETGFPTHPLPIEVEGVVNNKVWEERIQELCSASNVDWELVKIMEELHAQLVNGASSQVEPPGTELTKTNNWFSDPPRQLPKLLDTLASFTKISTLQGPSSI